MFISFAKNKDMKKSTKVLLIFYIILLIPAVFFGRYIFSSFIFGQESVSFDFNIYSILGIVFSGLALLLGIVLFFKFINSRAVDKAIFFTIMPSFMIYGVLIFILAQLSTYQNDTAKTVRTLLNINAENNYNTILWAVLLSIVFIIILFLNVIFLCKPINRVEKIVSRLGDGKIKDEKIKLGGVKQFENIEHSLNKINNNYREKDNSLRAFKLESEKYIPRQFFRFLGRNNISQLELGAQVKKKATTVLIKLSKSSTNQMSLEENFHYVNSYVNVISPLIRKFGGFIDKYLGDGILAVFPQGQDALDCLHALSRAIEIKNRQNKSLPKISLRAAVESEEVIFGVIGDQQRKIPTIVSDVLVSLEKIDEVSRYVAANVVFTKKVLDNLPLHYKFSYRFIGSLSQPDEKTLLFEDVEHYPKDKMKLLIKTKGIFEKGVLLYDNGEYKKAETYMEEVLKTNSGDRCAYIYFNKCKEKLH